MITALLRLRRVLRVRPCQAPERGVNDPANRIVDNLRPRILRSIRRGEDGVDSTVVGAAAGRQLALTRLRRAITDGELVPGQRLVESDLVVMLGVNRNGVRQALDALVAEGLVERIPNRGARVRTVSAEEAVAITECRMALEGLIAAKAATAATDDEIAGLRGHVQV